jgi:hypothetical protein
MIVKRHVLLVTNSTTDSEIALIKEAMQKAEKDGLQIKLSLMHVIPSLPTCYFNIPSMVVLAERYYEEAKVALTHAGEALGVGKDGQWLVTGKAKSEVVRLANKIDADFILAHSANIQELQKTFFFKKEKSPALIRSISAINSI